MAARSIFTRTFGVTLAACGAVVAGAIFVARGDAAQGKAIVRGNVPGEWRYWGADAWSTRDSPLDQINASNFNKLELAWHFKTDAMGSHPEYKLEGTPIEINGMLYTTAGSRRAVVALDAKTGELKWVYSMNEGLRAEIGRAHV